MRRNTSLIVVLLGLALLVWLERSNVAEGLLGDRAGQGNAAVADAYARELTDVWVSGEGRVVRSLADDNQGSRHQRFILDVGPDHTVLVAHNIDLAPRIEGLQRGDVVGFVGEYVWNAQGGIIHWTHHDPAGRHAGGRLEHGGRRYE